MLDVDKGVAALELGKNVGEQVEAGGFVRAEGDGPLNDAAAVGDDLHGFVAQAQEALGVVKKNDARGVSAQPILQTDRAASPL